MTRRLLALLFASACASPAAPPGGPPDLDPPQLMRVSPDSGRVGIIPKDVVFQFDEVVSETPRTGRGLSQLFLVSPSDGRLDVSWKRSSITVRPKRGWRNNTTYVVTMLPGITDLRGNTRDSTTVVVFSTGQSIPQTRLTGVVFDWAKGEHAPLAFVEARPADDTTIVSYTEADSLGRFVLPYLAPGSYLVRALIDANRNQLIDPRELWDSASVTLSDSASVELYAFMQDTIAPRIGSVTIVDSVTLRIALDRPLAPSFYIAGAVELRDADSVLVPLTRVESWAALSDFRAARERERIDSVAMADTNPETRAARDRALRDSVNRAALVADSLRRDTTRRVARPEMSRPALVTELGLEISVPLAVGTSYMLRVNAIGVLGAERSSERSIRRTEERRPPGIPPPIQDSGHTADPPTRRND